MDSTAFRRLLAEHQDAVYAFCVALVGAAEAEDIAQETFVRVHLAIDRFDPSGPATLRSWILTIARRLCHDRAKKRRLPEPDLIAAAPVPASPEDELAARRLSARLADELMRLPAEQRAVLALYEWVGLEYEEIADIERIPVGTVRSRLARAREALRAAIDAPDPHARTHARTP